MISQIMFFHDLSYLTQKEVFAIKTHAIKNWQFIMVVCINVKKSPLGIH